MESTDPKTILKSQILSMTNINFLVNMIRQQIKLSEKAIPKCINIITGYLSRYVENLDRYPEDNQELITAISFLNQKCFDEFVTYLATKYPGQNLTRDGNPIEDLIGQTTNQNQTLSSSQRSVNGYYVEEPVSIKKSTQSNSKGINGLSEHAVHNSYSDDFIIIDEDEKNRLLAKYNTKSTQLNSQFNEQPKSDPSTEFLSYLTNPMVLQMFSMMLNQVNQVNPSVSTNKKSQKEPYEIEAILDADQVKMLLGKQKNIKVSEKHVRTIPELNSSVEEMNVTDVTNQESDDELPDDPIIETVPVSKAKINKVEQSIQPKLDLSKGITIETLPECEVELKRLMELKNKYISERNFEMADEIDTQKRKIIEAMYDFKKSLGTQLKENKDRLANFTFTKNEEDGDNIEYLNLEIDPTDNFMNMKDIVIKCKAESKISELTLMEYYLPANTNNVTRFNNKFSVYCNGNLFKTVIPPAKYDIQTLFNYIQSQLTLLEFKVVDKDKITIRNTMGVKFDLMVGDDTVFPLLGFTENADKYKDNLIYTSNKAFSMTPSDKIIFCLSGTTMEPLTLDTDVVVKANKIIKKSRNGFNLRQFVLRFTNNLEQFYDFIFPIKMCLKITYHESGKNN
jgi:hypothetical protein